MAAELNVLLRNEKSVPCNLDALANSLQVLVYFSHANQLTDQSTIWRRGAQPGGLQPGFDLHLVASAIANSVQSPQLL